MINRFSTCFRLLSLLFAAVCAETLSAAGVADTLARRSVDSQKAIVVKKTHRAEFVCHLDVPTEGAPALRTGLTDWADELLASLTQVEPADSATRSDADALVAYYETRYLKQARAEIQDLVKQRDKDATMPINYVAEVKVTREYETAGIITYRADAYGYSGGAHGMSYTMYATFRKSDGRLLTWDDVVAPKRTNTFAALVADGVMSYFGVTRFEELRERLLIDTPYTRGTFPLPAGHPGLTADGLHVQYALYEITPYAAGAPSVTLPYARLGKVLNPTVKKLLQ